MRLMAPATPPLVMVAPPIETAKIRLPPPLLVLPTSINCGLAEFPKVRLPMLTAIGKAMVTLLAGPG